MPPAERKSQRSREPTSGARAETLAAEFLAARGLVLLERNFRARRGEIDLVMRDGASLVFVEVRLRTNAMFGGAAASITAAKRRHLWAAAQAYLARIGHEPPPCRFDAVLLDALAPDRITWERGILED
jgi:putative endonuclease